MKKLTLQHIFKDNINLLRRFFYNKTQGKKFYGEIHIYEMHMNHDDGNFQIVKEDLIMDMSRYNINIIVTQNDSKNSYAIIDICFENKASIEKNKPSFYLRFAYHKQRKEFVVHNTHKEKFQTQRLEAFNNHLIYMELPMISIDIENFFVNHIVKSYLDFSDIFKDRYKNTIIHSDGRFIIGSGYFQKHYIVPTEFKNIFIDISLEIFEEEIYSLYDCPWNVFSQSRANIPFYKIEYLKIREKDNMEGLDIKKKRKLSASALKYKRQYLDNWNNLDYIFNKILEEEVEEFERPVTFDGEQLYNDNTSEHNKMQTIINKSFEYVPEGGYLKIKRNTYYKYIIDNQLIRGIEWV